MNLDQNRQEYPVMEKQWKVPKNRHASRIQSTKRQTVIRELVTTMLKGGIIVKSNASHSSQVILAPKPDGTFQFCIDYVIWVALPDVADTQVDRLLQAELSVK